MVKAVLKEKKKLKDDNAKCFVYHLQKQIQEEADREFLTYNFQIEFLSRTISWPLERAYVQCLQEVVYFQNTPP